MALFVLGLLFSGLVPVASAATLGEQDDGWIDEYNRHKAHYVQMKEFYKDARQDWITNRNKVREYKAEGGEAFKTAQLTAKEAGQDYLIAAVDLIDSKLVTVMFWGQNEIGNEQDVKQITDEIEEQLEALRELKADIEAVDLESENAADELEDLAKKVETRWDAVKPIYKRWLGQNLAWRLQHVLNRFDSLGDHLQGKLDTVSVDDPLYPEMEQDLEEYKENVALAWEKYEAAVSSFKAIRSESDMDRLYLNGNDFLKNANSYLGDAYLNSRELIQSYKQSQE
ncbi:hypothetical protein CMO92_02450 [Candidatus Woesearchaeota archaeon]|nr:hypothetical protein [Candidatus Woesearchaeota archaeon]